jgi:hypothetical protein
MNCMLVALQQLLLPCGVVLIQAAKALVPHSSTVAPIEQISIQSNSSSLPYI